MKAGDRVSYVSPYRTGAYDAFVLAVDEEAQTARLRVILPGAAGARREVEDLTMRACPFSRIKERP